MRLARLEYISVSLTKLAALAAKIIHCGSIIISIRRPEARIFHEISPGSAVGSRYPSHACRAYAQQLLKLAEAHWQ